METRRWRGVHAWSEGIFFGGKDGLAIVAVSCCQYVRGMYMTAGGDGAEPNFVFIRREWAR